MTTLPLAAADTTTADNRVHRIRTLNDQMRRTGQGGRIVMTSGIAALPATEIADIVAAVASFDKFDADNNPWGEHDFARMSVGQHTVMWKFDYYDLTLTWGSTDPADPAVTTRVLTIMLAEEY